MLVVVFVLAAFVVAYFFYDSSSRVQIKQIDPNHLEKLEQLDFIDEKIIKLGEEEAKKHKVIFAGITRDNAWDLPIMIKNIERIGKYFKDYKVILFENDSTDQTKNLLQDWQSNNNKVKIITENFGNKKRPSIHFLSDIRNRYLKVILREQQYRDYDLVIIQDMDMSFGFDDRGIFDSLSKIKEWDAVCANGISDSRGRTHDVFAFRTDEYPLAPYEMHQYWLHDALKLRKVYDPKGDLVRVRSCFGGLAIYKKKFLEGCQYDSIKKDCEHVYLHQCMREKNMASIVMNPTMVVRYSSWRKFF